MPKNPTLFDRILRKINRTMPKVCEDVRVWSINRGGPEGEILDEPLSITRRPPRTIKAEIDPQYTTRYSANFRGRYLVPIPRARILGARGLVMLSTGEYAIESIYTRTLLDTEPFFQTSPKSYRTLKGSFFSLLGPWSAQGNYYHWLHDALLRLYRVQPKLPSTVKYLVPANLRPFQIDSLCMLGIEPNQYISLELDEAVQVEQLYFAPPTSHSGSDRAAADEWLREQFWHACGISHPVAKEYIYITRRRASRHIVNEKDVVNLLARHGFHTVTCEQLTLKEQVELFSQARVIVASHGAGLTNAWFAPSGAQVLDILQPSHKDWAYVFWSLCNALDHDYWYLWGESISTKETTPTENIVVSIERLRKTLEQMGISEKESRVTG